MCVGSELLVRLVISLSRLAPVSLTSCRISQMAHSRAINFRDFRVRLRGEQLVVEVEDVEDHGDYFSVTVRVSNYAYRKVVFIRATFSSWLSFEDIVGYWGGGNGMMDWFRINVPWPQGAPAAEFAAACEQAGSLCWDNNGGRNFVASRPQQLCLPPVPQKEEVEDEEIDRLLKKVEKSALQRLKSENMMRELMLEDLSCLEGEAEAGSFPDLMKETSLLRQELHEYEALSPDDRRVLETEAKLLRENPQTSVDRTLQHLMVEEASILQEKLVSEELLGGQLQTPEVDPPLDVQKLELLPEQLQSLEACPPEDLHDDESVLRVEEEPALVVEQLLQKVEEKEVLKPNQLHGLEAIPAQDVQKLNKEAGLFPPLRVQVSDYCTPQQQERVEEDSALVIEHLLQKVEEMAILKPNGLEGFPSQDLQKLNKEAGLLPEAPKASELQELPSTSQAEKPKKKKKGLLRRIIRFFRRKKK